MTEKIKKLRAYLTMFFISFIYYTYIVELVVINFQDLLPGLPINLLCTDKNKLLVSIVDILTQK